MAKVNGRSRNMVLKGESRVWRKLHLEVDTSTHGIAAELRLSNVTDAEVLRNLLKQTRRRIIEISGASMVLLNALALYKKICHTCRALLRLDESIN